MLVTIRENITLKPYTIFKIGGAANYFIEAKNKEDFLGALRWAEERREKVFILGAGSNVLVSDDGFDGLVIKNEAKNLEVGLRTGNPTSLIAESGVSMAEVVRKSVEAGLSGFEWAIGIPGTIGGSVRGNAGCFGKEMKDVVESVEVFDLKSGERSTLSARHCLFGYRDSVFKQQPELIILSALLKLQGGDPNKNPDKSRELVMEYTKKRIAEQDIGVECAGCIFKNPAPEIPAGRLIDSAGLKGKRIGQAMVSEKHANYFINLGNASARDVKKLIEFVKQKVFEKYNVHLEEEIQYVGDF